MGFINYHDTKEDCFSDVVEYAGIQKEMERRRLDEEQKRHWFAEFLGNPVYGKLEAKDTIKFVVKKYRDAADAYRKLISGAGNEATAQVDTGQIWKDLWVFTSWNCVEAAGISGAKKEQLLQVIYGKLLNLGEAEEIQTACRAYEKSRKYRRYLKQCFSLREDGTGQFWRWMGEKERRNGEDFAKLLNAYSEYTVFLSYYLYQSVHPGKDTWMYQAERTKRLLENLKMRCRNSASEAPVYRKMKNPLYAVEDREMLDRLRFRHVLLFGKYGRKDGKKEMETHTDQFVKEAETGFGKTEEARRITLENDGETEMIEDLYSYLESENKAEYTGFDNIESILPEGIIEEIRNGILPEMDGANVSGINPGEAVHYLDHGVLYCGEEKEDEVSFRKYKGTFAITDKNLVFRGGASLTEAFSSIERVIQYDMTPEILAIQTENNMNYFFKLPDMESAYKVLKLLANKEKGEPVAEEKHTVNYEELVEKADIGACIFAFECLETYWLPEELKQKISLLLRKLRGLKKTIEDYPERADEILRFLTYYIPEAVGIIDAYYNYQQAELDDKTMNKLYEKITASIDTLDAAVEKKIFSIYRLETMNTTAKADALRQIMEQDGYSKDKRILKL